MYKFTYTESNKEKLEKNLGAALYKFWQEHAPDDARILAEIFPNHMQRDVIEKQLKSMLFFLKLELADEIKGVKDNNRKTLEKFEEARRQLQKDKENQKKEFKNNCLAVIENIQSRKQRRPKRNSWVGMKDNIDCFAFLERKEFIKRGFFGGYRITKNYSESDLKEEIENKFKDDELFSRDFLKILRKII